MLINQACIFLKVTLILVFTLNQFQSKAQDIYEFSAPKTPYSSAYKSIKSNIYNQAILKHINSSHPIYINSTKINLEEIYIKERIAEYGTIFPLAINYYSRIYIRTYASEKNIKYASHLYNYFSPIITKNIEDNNLPEVFKLIPLVCSGFNPLSDNQKGGIGFWQLNYVPAIKYGLIVNNYIDERRDFNKSTKAATQYLKYIYTIYSDWELTLAAYSCGITTVNKALLRTNSNNFWDIYPYLPADTRDLVPALTAMAYCFNEAGNNHYLLAQIKEVEDTVYIDRKLQFKAIQAVIKLKPKELQYLNPTLNKNIFPANFMAVFPEGSCDKFSTFEDSIYYYQDSILLKPKEKSPAVLIPKDGKPFIYTVKSGDILGIIAERYNVRVSQIQDWNNINGTRIDIGQKLTIYGPKKNSSKSQPTKTIVEEVENTIIQEPKPINGEALDVKHSIYTVKSGDSLWLIAKKYSGVSAKNIMDFNGIGENLTVGQELKIPKY